MTQESDTVLGKKKILLSLGFNFVSGHICVWIITALPYTFGSFVHASVDLVIANYYEGCISSFYFKIPRLFFSVFAYSVVFSEVYILVSMTSWGCTLPTCCEGGILNVSALA